MHPCSNESHSQINRNYFQRSPHINFQAQKDLLIHRHTQTDTNTTDQLYNQFDLYCITEYFYIIFFCDGSCYWANKHNKYALVLYWKIKLETEAGIQRYRIIEFHPVPSTSKVFLFADLGRLLFYHSCLLMDTPIVS